MSFPNNIRSLARRFPITGVAVVALALFPAGSLKGASVDDLTYGIVDGSITITGCNLDATGELVVPSFIHGLPVTAISDYSIGGCKELTGVTLSPGMKTVGNFNFRSCPKLTRLHLSEGLIYIGMDCLAGSPNVREITIPLSVEHIDSYAFSLSSLRKVTILGADVIDQYAFADCVTLQEVIFGPKVRAIYGFSFMNCNLTSITFPETITYLGHYAFWTNLRLRKIAFLGDAPAYVDRAPFGDHLSKKSRIYYYYGKKGFESPTSSWCGITTEWLDPQMDVEQTPGKPVYDNDQPVGFPAQKLGKSGAWKTFRILNSGNYDLILSGISKNGGNPNDFLLKPFPETIVAPGASIDLKVKFRPTGTGPRKAAIHIRNNTRAGGSSFDIKFTGTGLPLAD